MQTASSVLKSPLAASKLDMVLSESIEGGMQAIHTQVDEMTGFWTKMRIQRQTGAIAGQTAIALFKVQNEAKERAISAVIIAKHGIVQKELLKANLAATAEVDAAIAAIFMETRARLTKIIAHDEQDLFQWEVTATEDIDAKVTGGKLSAHRAKASLARITEMVDTQLEDNKAVVDQIIQTLRDRVAQALKPFATTH